MKNKLIIYSIRLYFIILFKYKIFFRNITIDISFRFLIPKEQYLILIKYKNKKIKETILFYFDLNEGISLYDLENYKEINSFYNIMNNYCLYRDDIIYYLIELDVFKKNQ